MNIVVVVPVYNEEKIIDNLLDEMQKGFMDIKGHKMEILVVDGKSDDKTLDIVKNKKSFYENLHLLEEKERRGIGAAYVAGINYAVNFLKADAFIEFDGDFQHDPKYIKNMVRELDDGYDYVIGSRYVGGGEIPQNWSFYRKFLSMAGGRFIRFVLNLPIKDTTSGMKLSRVAGFFKHLPLDDNSILSLRHAYKIHLLYGMTQLGAKIKEVPIRFLERKNGSSKSNMEDIRESLRVVFALRFSSKANKARQFETQDA